MTLLLDVIYNIGMNGNRRMTEEESPRRSDEVTPDTLSQNLYATHITTRVVTEFGKYFKTESDQKNDR